ncbi:unnamed protein product [Dovyalis caffra]|uniref:F-box associated domain-containing protein n=1 Tax=Dovyalis caffra TaxID=77055 RepID=A0AAV1S2P2_9ROSI|nr:unnamed protein product [Dovyalis caffra]
MVSASSEGWIVAVSLAFDPSKSFHFKVICVWRLVDNENDHQDLAFLVPQTYQIGIYSSETASWGPSGDPFSASITTDFDNGVFWNVAIHWLCQERSCLYFDVDKECLRTMCGRPCLRSESMDRFRYFGECCGRLLLVEVDMLNDSVFHVLEVERDQYSRGWVTKYCISLDRIGVAFGRSIFSVVGADQEDGLALVIWGQQGPFL